MTSTSRRFRLVSKTMPDLMKGEVVMAEPPTIRCQGLSKSFGAVPAVADVSLALEPGEILAMVGPSGSGKTSFLRLVAGFEVPDAGEITLERRAVAGPGAWVPPESRRLGMVFQEYALFPHMTVVQNVAYGLSGRPRHTRARRARQMLELVHLAHVAERFPHQLSGGEQQRVALARSLAPQPVALLLDEPFSNLDPQLRVQLRAELRGILRSSGVTSIYVTHDQEEALYMGDRVAVMNAGRIEQVGTPEDIFHHPHSRFVARFLGLADFIPARASEDGLATDIGLLHTPTRLAPGTEVEVMVRPDDVGIRPSSAGPGLVVSRVFRGMHYLYRLSLASGTTVHSLQHHTANYREGDPVEVFLEPGQTLICFTDGGSGPQTERDHAFSARTDDSSGPV